MTANPDESIVIELKAGNVEMMPVIVAEPEALPVYGIPKIEFDTYMGDTSAVTNAPAPERASFTTPGGRVVYSEEEASVMPFPYPPEPEL